MLAQHNTPCPLQESCVKGLTPPKWNPMATPVHSSIHTGEKDTHGGGRAAKARLLARLAMQTSRTGRGAERGQKAAGDTFHQLFETHGTITSFLGNILFVLTSINACS